MVVDVSLALLFAVGLFGVVVCASFVGSARWLSWLIVLLALFVCLPVFALLICLLAASSSPLVL